MKITDGRMVAMTPSKKNNLNWSKALIAEVERELAAKFGERGAPAGREARSRLLLEELGALSESMDARILLKRLLLTQQLLEADAGTGFLSRPDVNRLLADGQRILKLAGIAQKESKLATLHARLAQCEADYAARDGDHLAAMGSLLAARASAYRWEDEDAAGLAMRMAETALRLGHADLARLWLDPALASAHTDIQAAAVLIRIRCARLGGQGAEALALIDEAAGRPAPAPDAGRAELAWERLCLAVSGDDGELAPMLAAVARDDELATVEHLVAAVFWAHASRRRGAREALPRMASLRRRATERGDGPRLKTLLKLIDTLDQGYDQRLPLTTRSEKIWQLLEQRRVVATVEQELLLLAGCARWMQRHNQWVAAEFALSEYRRLGLALSGGKYPDPLCIIVDALAAADRRQARREAPAADAAAPDTQDLSASRWSRGFDLVRITTGAMAGEAASKIRRAFAPAADRALMRAADREALRARFIKNLGAMRGIIMKFAQSIGYLNGAVLGVETIAELGSQSRAAPAAKAPEVAAILERELGKPPSELFQEWNPLPLATASIGQVHWARLADGREVAVKVQVPRMTSVVQADIKNLGLLRPHLQRLLPNTDVGRALTHLRTTFERELDYRHEADTARRLRQEFAGDPEIHVPAVVDELSTSLVLTAEFVRGRDFRELIEGAAQAEKDRAGRVIYRFAERCLWSLRSVNADPNPGNFLFMDDGRIAFVDFGAICPLDPAVHAARSEAVRALVTEDWATLERLQPLFHVGAADLGSHRQRAAVAVPHLTATGPFRFGRDFVLGDAGAPGLSPHPGMAYPEGVLTGFRAHYGLLAILTWLEAGADWRALTHAELVRAGIIKDSPSQSTAAAQ